MSFLLCNDEVGENADLKLFTTFISSTMLLTSKQETDSKTSISKTFATLIFISGRVISLNNLTYLKQESTIKERISLLIIIVTVIKTIALSNFKSLY